MSRLHPPAALTAFLIIIIACLCSCSSSAPPISVQVTAAATQIDQTQSISVAATVSNDSSGRGVLWSLTGPGSLTNQSSLTVTYDAPSNGSGAQSATVTATSAADNTKMASVKITVNTLPSITTLSLPNSTVSILLGNGDGTFTPASSSPVALTSGPTSVAVGDFNSSGRLGIAVATESNVIVLVQQP
jgi:hypothetical protein